MRWRNRRRIAAAVRDLTGELTGRTVGDANALVTSVGARLHDISEYCMQGRAYVYVYVRVCDGRVARVLSVA